MTRRPRRDRPPRLADRPHATPEATTEVVADRALVRAGVWGPHPRLGREEVRAAARRAANAEPVALEVVLDALEAVAGPQATARAVIDPDRAARAVRAAAAHLAEAADAGVRVACATAAPASLLALHTAVAGALSGRGARLATAVETGPYESGRRLWWVDAVAVATDGADLVAETRAAAADEWLFAVGRPGLAVADGVFADAALAAGIPTVALADVDAPGPALAADRGCPVIVVPVALGQPPSAYAPLAASLVTALGPSAVAGLGAHGGDAARHGPHLATETPFPYAAPPNGGEG